MRGEIHGWTSIYALPSLQGELKETHLPKGSNATFEHLNLEVTGKIKHPKQQIVQGKEQNRHKRDPSPWV
jgi:hypothetical protein